MKKMRRPPVDGEGKTPRRQQREPEPEKHGRSMPCGTRAVNSVAPDARPVAPHTTRELPPGLEGRHGAG